MLQRTQNALPLIVHFHPLKEPTVFIASLVARIQAYLRYRETVRELSKLSDRELDDLGLLRADIHNIARHYAAA
ncbi:MAG: DUF1127 domain-containing protein [Bosea sp.]|jgi:uncharacterized protein YjiS (DUF1127 family)|nr:DUF1127 domain-containing protein [Bosea sp. (in: a-proteobacteria)]